MSWHWRSRVALLGATALALSTTHCAAVRTANAPPAEAAPSEPPVLDAAQPESPSPRSPGPEPEPEPEAREASVVEAPEPPRKKELPRGGRTLFPEHRLVGFCGTPGAPALGRLLGDLKKSGKKALAHADKYATDPTRRVLPVFELIAVVVQGAPGKDKKWRRRVPTEVVDQYLQAARAAKALLLLNIQPGHSDFLTEAKHFERYLREPDVGLALDPEWAMRGKQRPGVFYGQATGAAIDEVAAYLAGIVSEGDLPEKALVYHQVNNWVVKDPAGIGAHPGVAIIQSVDGLGPKGAKITTYNALVKTKPDAVRPGFKLFFDEDLTNGGKLMTPAQVLALTPVPEYVMYE